MRRLLLGLALVALALTCAPAIGGSLVTNDGSFYGPNPCTTAPAVIPTPLTINTITQVIPAVAGQAIHICAWDYGVQNIVGNTGVYLSYGTGTNCGTGNTIFDSSTLFDGSSTTGGEFVSPWAQFYFTAPVSTAVCIDSTGASGTLVNTGTIKYAQFRALLAAVVFLSSIGASPLITNDGSFATSQQCPSVFLTPALTPGTTTQVIATPAAGQAIHICQWTYGVQNLTSSTGAFLSYGTGANCATGNTVIDSATMFAGATFTSGSFVSPFAVYYLTVPTGNEVCLLQGGVANTQFYTGSIKYAIF